MTTEPYLVDLLAKKATMKTLADLKRDITVGDSILLQQIKESSYISEKDGRTPLVYKDMLWR